ncbi:MAG: hypothetical protein L6Q54_11725 [Leptospiraceae bacterium]|nr:hypothetical protein [Leptospiraceae bacterium]
MEKEFIKNLVHRREGAFVTDEEIEIQHRAWVEREKHFVETGEFKPVGEFL